MYYWGGAGPSPFFAILMCNVMCTILLLFVACMYTVNTVNCPMIQFTSFLSIVSISCYL